MDHELNQAIELAAHLHTASELARLQVQRLEQRNAERLKKARQRMNAPTTLPTHEDGSALSRRTA